VKPNFGFVKNREDHLERVSDLLMTIIRGRCLTVNKSRPQPPSNIPIRLLKPFFRRCGIRLGRFIAFFRSMDGRSPPCQTCPSCLFIACSLRLARTIAGCCTRTWTCTTETNREMSRWPPWMRLCCCRITQHGHRPKGVLVRVQCYLMPSLVGHMVFEQARCDRPGARMSLYRLTF
jgi:hypothetical protein